MQALYIDECASMIDTKRPVQSKNRYSNRASDISDETIAEMAHESVDHEEDLWFPMTEKSYDSLTGMKLAMGMKLDDRLCNLFMYTRALIQLDNAPVCVYCDDTLGIDSFAYSMRVAKRKEIGHSGMRDSGFSKYCPACRSNSAWLLADNPNRDTEAIGRKISASMTRFAESDEGQKFYERNGRENSKKLRKFYATDEGARVKQRAAEKQSRTMKRKIKDGEFTPPVNNRFTSWSAEIEFADGTVKSYRSSWEACVHLSNPELRYESVRIPYEDSDGIERVYIADFEDPSTECVIEIKPKKYWAKQSHKMDQIISFCKRNSRPFKWINEHNITQWVDESAFAGSETNTTQLRKLKRGLPE